MHVGKYISGFGLCTLDHSLLVGNDNCSQPSGLSGLEHLYEERNFQCSRPQFSINILSCTFYN